jgi:hypothetical protein
MLRLHRVGIGTFAAMFGLMFGSSVRGEDDPFAKLMPRKVGSSACFHRDYDAAHLKQHPRQATQSIVMSLKYEIPESLHPSARVMMRRKGAKEPLYVAAGCGWGEHSAKDAKAAQRLLGAMRDRVRLQPSNQFLQILRGHGILGDDQIRIACEQSNRLEILQNVVLERVGCSVYDMRAEVTYNDGVAIGHRTSDAADPEGACCTSYVFNNGWLTKCGPHSLAGETGECVKRPARWERHDYCDGPRRVGLSPSKTGDGRQRGSARGQM